MLIGEAIYTKYNAIDISISLWRAAISKMKLLE